MRVSILLLLLPVILSSCLGTKYLKKDESVLRKQKIKTSGVPGETLQGQLAQSPNTRLGGLPIAHLFHIKKLGESFYDSTRVAANRTKIDHRYRRKIEHAKSTKRKNKLNSHRTQKLEKKDKKLKQGNQLMRWGENLAVFDSLKVATSVNNLSNYLFSKGYFNTQVLTDISTHNKKTIVTYLIDEQLPYTIDSMVYDIKDNKVAELFYDHIDEQLLQNQTYDQELFGAERTRVYDLMTNNGFYNFKRQYVLFEVDSSLLNDHKLVVRQTITNPPNKSKHKTYRLDSVIFSTEQTGTRYLKPVEYSNITYNFKGSNYSERLLSRRIFLPKDSLYSKQLTLETQRQLSYLDIFKFVNVNYDTTSNHFIANIFTSPLKKYQTSTEAGLSLFESQGSIPGPFFNLNVKGRNVFGGLEIIQFDANANIQGLKSVTEDKTNEQGSWKYSRLQYGGKISLTFPQFLFPLNEKLRNQIGKYNPRTKVSVGVNFEDRIEEYKRNTVNTNMSYIWQVRDKAQYTFTLFDANYIFSEITDSFRADLDSLDNPSISAAFQPSFFVFSSFTARYNRGNYGVGNNDAYFIQTSVESGGNLLGVFNQLSSFKTLENFNYLKASFEFRQSIKLTTRSSMAYRVNFGGAFSYGSNGSLPYEKYFFAGGSNSIRAWAPRRLGPGAYAEFNTEAAEQGLIQIDYSNERAGDILLESSVEFRSNLVGFIDYALFVDAGNMWLWKSTPLMSDGSAFIGIEDDDGVFRLKQLPGQIAVGTGFGLRLDFSFLVLRLDLAYKVIDPGMPQGSRFRFSGFHFNDLWQEPILNIGIGYPF